MAKSNRILASLLEKNPDWKTTKFRKTVLAYFEAGRPADYTDDECWAEERAALADGLCLVPDAFFIRISEDGKTEIVAVEVETSSFLSEDKLMNYDTVDCVLWDNCEIRFFLRTVDRYGHESEADPIYFYGRLVYANG